MKRLVIGLVVLAVLALVVDRGGDLLAERAAATTLAESQQLESQPDVDIAGFPFLDQAVGREFDEVRVRADDVGIGESPVQLTISRMDVVFRDLEVSSDLDTISARTATADALITFDDLGDTLGVDITAGEGGQIAVSRSFTVAGQTLEPEVSVEPMLVNGALAFGAPAISGVNDATGAIAAALNDAFGVAVPLDGLPFQIGVRSLSVDEDGLRISLRGRDLSYSA